MDISAENRYWIISFTLDDAHVIETEQGEDYSKPLRTFRVYYRDLKYKYMDIEKEARRDAILRKEQLDPRIVFNLNYSIEYVLSLPPMNDRKDKESLAETLGALREMADYLKEEFIAKYDDAQRMSEEELYRQIHDELEKKKDYVPEEIRKLTQGELSLGLPQAGYLTGAVEFTTLDNALSALDHRWKDIWNDAEKIKYMKELELLASNVAQERMPEIFGGLF